MPAWWDKLVGRSETPLKALESDDLTAEDIFRALQRVQRDNAELRLEWGEMLDKLTRLANRASARERTRARRQLDEAEEEEEEPRERPVMPPIPPEPAPAQDIRRMNKRELIAYLRARNGH